MTYSSELRAQLEAGIAELEDDLERLRRALAALDGGAPTAAPRGRRRRSRSSAGVQPEALLATLAEDEGASTAELARVHGASQARVLTVLKELEAEGRARRTGQRRGTRWYAASEGPPAPPAEPAEAPPIAAEPAETPPPAAEPAESPPPAAQPAEAPPAATQALDPVLAD